jgi:hypothetical protein
MTWQWCSQGQDTSSTKTSKSRSKFVGRVKWILLQVQIRRAEKFSKAVKNLHFWTVSLYISKLIATLRPKPSVHAKHHF